MPTQDDTPQLRDIPAAIGLLTRLPVPVDIDHATARGAKAAWAYPIAGLVVALITWGVAQTGLLLGLPTGAIAGLILATLAIVTGAMHEDGLADSADGLWGGWDVDRRLEIMKDSHIGAYGVIALILSIGLRWQALIVLISAGALVPALITCAVLSRAAMVPLMAKLPNARASGLSHTVGRASTTTAVISYAIGGLAALLSLDVAAVWVVLAVGVATAICAALAMAKIKGQTGDILGATQQVTEITALLTLSVLLA